jgi:hypothetical protein
MPDLVRAGGKQTPGGAHVMCGVAVVSVLSLGVLLGRDGFTRRES